jgi:hypothetical protein
VVSAWRPRPEGIIDHGYASAWIYAAVRPGSDDAFALVLPEVGAAAMQVALPPACQRAYIQPLLLDGAGWHTAGDIATPCNTSFVSLPPYSPSLNPAERVWLYLRERFLSLRLFADLGDIIDGSCKAWNRLLTEQGRLATLTNYPYLQSVRTS